MKIVKYAFVKNIAPQKSELVEFLQTIVDNKGEIISCSLNPNTTKMVEYWDVIYTLNRA